LQQTKEEFTMRTHKIALLFFIPFLLAACSAVPQNETFTGEGAAPQVEEFLPADSDLGGRSLNDAANPPAQPAERLVIKNANLSIVVPEPEESLTAITRMAEGMDGFVVSSNLFQTTLDTGEEIPRATITVRVPADRLNEATAQIEESASQVLSKNVSGDDVTQEYTDLQSRLRNLEAAETQLMAIMEDANRTEDVINVFNQLTSIREQIEVTKGRIQYLEQSAALSAITVDIIADAAVQPLNIGGWQLAGVAKNAIQALINALKFMAKAVIWLLLFLLPTLLVLAVPVLLLVWLVRSWRRRRATPQPPAAPTND
jgi:Domain of unknown function (DUF4349)